MKHMWFKVIGWSGPGRRAAALPLVLMLLMGLWLLAVIVLMLCRVERRSAVAWSDRAQAEWALQSGIEDASARLELACDNEDFLIVAERGGAFSQRQAARLFASEPRLRDGGVVHERSALFSWRCEPGEGSDVLPPESFLGAGEDSLQLPTHPWLDPVTLDWLVLNDEAGRAVARYAFWIEDLQGLVDPLVAGNSEGPGGSRHQVAYPFPAPGVDDQPAQAQHAAANQIALEALDPDWQPGCASSRCERLLSARSLLVSPGSVLAAAGFEPPLHRIVSGERAGRLEDPWAAALECHAVVGIQAYDELPRVPFAAGLAPEVMGLPKLNLNRLLAAPRDQAVDDMARWVRTAMPEFAQRAGGFPEDYVATLAAGALDYADTDHESVRQVGRYRGLEAEPVLSELVLHLHFQGLVRGDDGRWVLKWTLRLFAEFWNPTNQPIESGRAQLSYEVNLRPGQVGLGKAPQPFDDPQLLLDARQCSHDLQCVGGRFLTAPVSVALRPDEYRFHEMARVDYRIDCVPQLDEAGLPRPEGFDLIEAQHEARGVSLCWNGREIQRLERIERDADGVSDFRTDRSRKAAKACIVGLNYGSGPLTINNPGDPRIASYLRDLPLGENAYPDNVSPHRRNLRRGNVYDKDPSALKTRHYGRVLPSQWPDGGHDSPTGDFRVTSGIAALPTDESKWPLADVPEPSPGNAPQRLSDLGLFSSATELGHVHDPIMWEPVYGDLEDFPGSGVRDTRILNGTFAFGVRPTMPLDRMRWPLVSATSRPSRLHGGGNTLRIGRPEHPRFDRPGLRAVQWLDLFHAGVPNSLEPERRQGPLQRIEGQVNLNTASRDVLRCLAAGTMQQDPLISRITDWNHDTTSSFAPRSEVLRQDDPARVVPAERIADAIIAHRPLISPTQLATLADGAGHPVFGGPDQPGLSGVIQMSDAAAEEAFARVYNNSTVRSRNFRIWLIGQSLGGRPGQSEVLAQVRRMITVFVDPGPRDAQGVMLLNKPVIRILHAQEY